MSLRGVQPTTNERLNLNQTMRGMRIGQQSLETGAGVRLSERQEQVYICSATHETRVVFAADAEVPDSWQCSSCAKTAIRSVEGKTIEALTADDDGPKTHYDMLLERRSEQELEDLLAERIEMLRAKRKRGEADL